MNLYLDLNKAVQVPSTSGDRVDGRTAARAHRESFNRRGPGALGGDPTHDDPDVGNAWTHGEDDAELEEARKLDSQIAADRGIVRGAETKKAQEAVEILKSFTQDLRYQMAAVAPNEREVEYLTSVCGYSVDDVMKGRAKIVGSERSRFNSWLHERLQASLSRLAK